MSSFFRLFFIAIFSLTFLSACQSEDDDWGSDGANSQYFYFTLDPSGGEFLDIEVNCPGFKKLYKSQSISIQFETTASVDLSACVPIKFPSEIKINPPNDVYEFKQFCNKRNDVCYLPSELSDFSVDTNTLFTAEYKVNRGKVAIDANGGYFPNDFSTSRDNVSYVIFAGTDGTFDLPAGDLRTVTNPGNIFQGWKVEGDLLNEKKPGGTTGLKYVDYSSDITLGITVTAQWLADTECCSLKFWNTNGTDDNDNITLLINALTENGKVGYGTQIELPDWYDISSGDWGGAGDTRYVLKHWELNNSSVTDEPHNRGEIFIVVDNSTFTAVLDSGILGIAAESELKALNNDSGSYRLVSDIALGEDWSPISFKGILDGGGKTVSGINFSPSQTTIGFFGELEGTVDNLTLAVANGGLTYTSLASDVYYGVFAGKLLSGGELLNVSATGTISVNATGFTYLEARKKVYAGGLVGSAAAGSTITNSSSRVDVSAYNRIGSSTAWPLSINPYAYAGGIAGINEGGILTNIYAGGNVLANSNVQGTTGVTDDAECFAGGIVGSQTAGSITYSYTYGNIIAEAYSPDTPIAYAGGIAGVITGGTINNSLAISIWIDATTKHPNGSNRATPYKGRIAASVGTSAANNGKIYGNADLNFAEGATIWNGAGIAHYFRDLSWFWDTSAIAFNRGTTDSTPWIEDEYFKYPCPLTMCPIFYWER